MNLGHTISQKIISNFRKIKLIYGGGVSENYQATPSGFDSIPLKNSNPVQITGKRNVVVGYIQKAVDDLIAGESIMFSKDKATGTIEATLIARGDGTLEINGDDDYAVRYTKLETAYNELQLQFNAHVTTFNAHVHPIPFAQVIVAASTPVSSPTATPASPSIGDISLSKVPTVKLP